MCYPETPGLRSYNRDDSQQTYAHSVTAVGYRCDVGFPVAPDPVGTTGLLRKPIRLNPNKVCGTCPVVRSSRRAAFGQIETNRNRKYKHQLPEIHQFDFTENIAGSAVVLWVRLLLDAPVQRSALKDVVETRDG
ncbi:hypothetical protein RP20_CCG015002 [Aedes albopictus]|nr:hypothetical protein RP20_CCG015002 [Aedes albopictus]